MQPRLSITEVLRIVENVKYLNWKLKVRQESSHMYLQVSFHAQDAETGAVEEQKCRKWLLSPFMTETEVVETAFKAVEAAVIHEMKEAFTYHDQRVYSPHFDVKERLRLAAERRFETRTPPSLVNTG